MLNPGRNIVEVRSKYCKLHVKKKRFTEKDSLSICTKRNSHMCKSKYIGGTGGIKAEGPKPVLSTLINTKYVMSDSDSKSYTNINNLYVGMEIKYLNVLVTIKKRVVTM